MMESRLNPQFVGELLKLLSHPPAMVDAAMQMFFPERAEEFRMWAQAQTAPPTYLEVYGQLMVLFPRLSKPAPNTSPDDCFREVLRCILADALDLDYKPRTQIVLAR